MKTKLIIFILLLSSSAFAQEAIDTVIIKVGEGSKVIFAIKDKKDLETMKKYNFQKLMDDMIYKLEVRDSSRLNRLSSEFLKKDSANEVASTKKEEAVQDNSSKSDNHDAIRYHGRRTRNTFNIDWGMNNHINQRTYASPGDYHNAVHTWGSWYVALNSVYRTHMANKFFLEWGYGVSWYNFKFQNPQTQVTADGNGGVNFNLDSRGYNNTKSKLTAAFVNISAVPVIDFGENKWKPSVIDGHHSDGFRIGVGPYVGYLLDSYTKQVYYTNNDKHRERHHDSFYLNNLRYGVRLQVGFRDVDFFFNYDLNPLFSTKVSTNPDVNAFSFGVTF